jgi:hypothetical protein
MGRNKTKQKLDPRGMVKIIPSRIKIKTGFIFTFFVASAARKLQHRTVDVVTCNVIKCTDPSHNWYITVSP